MYYIFPLLDALTFHQYMLFYFRILVWIFIFSISMAFNFNEDYSSETKNNRKAQNSL